MKVLSSICIWLAIAATFQDQTGLPQQSTTGKATHSTRQKSNTNFSSFAKTNINEDGNDSYISKLEWDAEWPGPQVIVEVSEKAPNASTTSTVEDGPKIIVRTEEVLIVGAILLLWVGAIALFFNRWGKIRMLEPYQPKFQQQHRSSCPLVEMEPIPALKHPSFSRISMGVSLPVQMPSGRMGSISGASGSNLFTVRSQPQFSRNRQNSVFVGPQYVAQKPSRKYQSAMDIHSLVLDEAPEPV